MPSHESSPLQSVSSLTRGTRSSAERARTYLEDLEAYLPPPASTSIRVLRVDVLRKST
jgi:hypothetical protein